MLVKENWTIREIESEEKEALIVEVNPTGNSSILITSIYNHPTNFVPSNFIRKVDRLSKKKPTILIGDFNAAAAEFGSRTSTKEGERLVEDITNSSLMYMENEDPTYISNSSSDWNILDLAFVNKSMAEKVTSFGVGQETQTDHFPLIVDIAAKYSNKAATKEVVDWEAVGERCNNSANLEEIVDDLERMESTIMGGGRIDINDVDGIVKRFTEELTEIRASSSIIIKSRIRRNVFKIAPDTKEAIRVKRRIGKRYLVNKERLESTALKAELKAATANLRLLLNRDKKVSDEEKVAEIEKERDQGKKWRRVNEMMGRAGKSSNAPLNHLTKPNGEVTTNLKEILDTHAARLYETHKPGPPAPSMKRWNDEVIKEVEENKSIFQPLEKLLIEEGDERIKGHFTKEKLKEEIRKLNKKTAPGDDGISNIYLQNIPEKAIDALFKLYNICMATGHFPRPWKKARVRMALKKGRDRKLSKNYRPISLLSNVGKLFEKLIKSSLDEETKNLDLIPEIHSGFKAGRSTQENFIRLSDSISNSFKRKKVVVGAFIDIERAFDALHHDSLRVKMMSRGIPPKLTRIISSFLTDRFLYVAEGDCRSDEVRMEGGCPQGAILSPPLFVIYDSDAPIKLDGDNASGAIFADDTSVWCVGDSVDEAVIRLQSRLHHLDDWSKRWRMAPAPAKSSLICFSKQRRIRDEASRRDVFLMDKKIEWSDACRFLGVTYDGSLSFKPHIEKIIADSAKKILSIKKLTRFGNIKNPSTVTSLINSLITSSFDYSSPAYLGMSEIIWGKVDAFFARMIKSLFGLPFNSSNLNALNFYLGGKASVIIKDRAMKRIGDITRSVPIVSDGLPMISENLNKRPIGGPSEYCLRAMNHDGVSCVFCSCGVSHSCVKMN